MEFFGRAGVMCQSRVLGILNPRDDNYLTFEFTIILVSIRSNSFTW